MRIALLLLMVSACVSPARAIVCLADLDHDRQTTVDEVLSVVDAALTGCDTVGCDGDRNADGSVTVEEVIGALTEALIGCDSDCPLRIWAEAEAFTCVFRGQWNTRCGTNRLRLELSITHYRGEWTAYADVLDVEPPATFVSEPKSFSADSMLVGWLDDETWRNLSGTLALRRTAGSLPMLIVDPSTSPFSIDDCPFDRFQGSLVDVIDHNEPR